MCLKKYWRRRLRERTRESFKKKCATAAATPGLWATARTYFLNQLLVKIFAVETKRKNSISRLNDRPFDDAGFFCFISAMAAIPF